MTAADPRADRVRQRLAVLTFLSGPLLLALAAPARAEFTLVRDGQPRARILVDARGAAGSGAEILDDAANWLRDAVRAASGAELQRAEDSRQDPLLILARADAWPDVARRANLAAGVHDAYAIVVQPQRTWLLGNSETATRLAVADLLHQWGFRWFAPSPRWHLTPERPTLTVAASRSESPRLIERRVWYAYGMSGEDLAPLMDNYQRWAIGNRLSVRSRMQTGHSYGNMILRNPREFEQHPEYYALLEDGQRDASRAVNARKFCTSNPGLLDLVAEDRQRLLAELRKADPAAHMVSVDPSDGEGTCHCEACGQLGTTSDRVFHLANRVARGLRQTDPAAWVGLYAYSSHRLPPTMDVEPNVYVQVAMGFNRTSYTLPELVEAWSRKVSAIGLREYYGVEAWDWGLPGRMRGGQVAYHRKWIPYYAARRVNAINAETNANWGGQSLGLYVAARLMWDPDTDVDALLEDYFQGCYGQAAETMKSFHARLDSAPPLRAATLLPLFDDLQQAWQQSSDAGVRRRLVDLMAYLVYVARFREFDQVRNRRPTRDDAYYQALLPLMQYAWRIRHRDVVHYYALARRLCNGLPVQDNRLDFYLANKEQPPVWMQGEAYTDDQIQTLFTATADRLRADDDPTVAYSRMLDPLRADGSDAGPCRILADTSHVPNDSTDALARFRSGLRGYLVARGQETVALRLAATDKQVTLTVYDRGDTILAQHTIRNRPQKASPAEASPEAASGNLAAGPVLEEVRIALPRAGEYRVDIQGNFLLRVPETTPLALEASVQHPAWIDYSGPHYFYVPHGTSELIVDADPRVSLVVPGRDGRLDIHPAERAPGKDYAVVPVPPGADGKIWHTTNMTRGRVALLNVPPLLSFHRQTLFVPREVAESERAR